MSNRRSPVRWALAFGGLALFAMVSRGSAQDKHPSFAGTWNFNAEKTRDAVIRADQAVSVPDKVRQGGRTMGAVSEGRSGGSAPSGGAAGGRPELGALGAYARPLPQLVFVQTDSSITVSDPSGTPRTYRIDGRKVFEPLPGSDSLEVVAKLKDGKLTVERKLGRLGTLREVYSIDKSGRELIMDIRMSSPSLVPPLDMRRIYDAAPGS